MDKRLELYIHIPFCVKKCNYCDFLSFPADNMTQQNYVSALLEEIKFYGRQMKEYRVPTIFIGGGTPSWLDEELVSAIMSQLYLNFNIDDDAEITIECNPGTVTLEKLEAFRKAGINRISIGMQSADDEELQLLGRIHSFDQFLKTYEWARNAGFDNINVDLISCLPFQTAEKFAATLNKLIRLKPEHISVYTLIIEKGTPFYDKYKFDMVKIEAGMKTEELPDEDEGFRIYKATSIVLSQAGYKQYEISNYARKGYECRHNIGYWTRENYLGLGLGASSLIENVRYTNTRDLYEYMDTIRESKLLFRELEDYTGPLFYTSLHTEASPVKRKAQMEEFMFLGLRMKDGVYRRDFENSFGISIDAIYGEIIASLRNDGLMEMKSGQIYLTEKGMDLSNYCMSKFLL